MDRLYEYFYSEQPSNNSDDENAQDLNSYNNQYLHQPLPNQKEVATFMNTNQAQTTRLEKLTLFTNLTHTIFEKKEKQVEKEEMVHIHEENKMELKKSAQYSRIKTNRNRLIKTSKSYRGLRKETLNLNKYFSVCLRGHISTLSACKLVDQEVIRQVDHALKKGKLNEVDIPKEIEQHCNRYFSSSEVIKKLMASNKMAFQNKLASVKYVEKARRRILEGKGKQKWKSVA